jgi:hypothetical protein
MVLVFSGPSNFQSFPGQSSPVLVFFPVLRPDLQALLLSGIIEKEEGNEGSTIEDRKEIVEGGEFGTVRDTCWVSFAVSVYQTERQ